MSPLEMQLHDLKNGPLHHFSDWPNKDMPRAAAGVYSIWNKSDDFIYVGMAGNGKTADDIAAALAKGRTTGLRDRLGSHASGRRSGDQFCVYVQDLLLLPQLTSDHIDKIVTRELAIDRLVRDYVHAHLSYRYVITEDGKAALELERNIINGALGDHPILNPPAGMR
ncbi:unannotated protein [freshwater metagenome]|uniref:Unannotated protein n=1 Tax=freshwater metagenome TaxID=449393 RepID=A0A6J6LXK0_9ZZZZ